MQFYYVHLFNLKPVEGAFVWIFPSWREFIFIILINGFFCIKINESYSFENLVFFWKITKILSISIMWPLFQSYMLVFDIFPSRTQPHFPLTLSILSHIFNYDGGKSSFLYKPWKILFSSLPFLVFVWEHLKNNARLFSTHFIFSPSWKRRKIYRKSCHINFLLLKYTFLPLSPSLPHPSSLSPSHAD